MIIKAEVKGISVRNGTRYISVEWTDDITENEAFRIKVTHSAEFEDKKGAFALMDEVIVEIRHRLPSL